MDQARRASDTSPPPEVSGPAAARATYTTPRLERLGEIRELTLGGSPGSGDSGSPTSKRTKM